jgi:hypothetical protein
MVLFLWEKAAYRIVQRRNEFNSTVPHYKPPALKSSTCVPLKGRLHVEQSSDILHRSVLSHRKGVIGDLCDYYLFSVFFLKIKQ